MSPAIWHLLILWMTLVSYPTMSWTHSSYVSEFEYAPRLHPSRNPNCLSRFTGDRKICDEFDEWDRPSIEIRAVLSRCSTFGKEKYDREQNRGTITNCSKKIIISMRFNNIGKTETEEKFVVIDHVLNSLTMKKIPLKSPYVIKVRQDAILQMYGMKFQSVVNAEAREEVINNRSPNFMGCNVDSDKPTCGQKFTRGKPVPFSQGFCCSCDPRVNDSHQFGGTNASFKSSRGDAKPNYKDAANKRRNRFRMANGHSSSDDSSMAERQTHRDKARSEKKSTLPHANPIASQTIDVPSDSLHGKGKQGKRIDDGSCEESFVNKETRNQEESLGSGNNEVSNDGALNSLAGEKYSGKQVEVSSTPQTVAGTTPSCDKVKSGVDAGQDHGPRKEKASLERKIDRLISLEKKRNRMGEENSKLGGCSTNRNPGFTSVGGKGDEVTYERTGGSNREFQSVDSKAEIKKLSREEEERASRSNSQTINELSSDLLNSHRDADTVRSTEYTSVRKLVIERWPKKMNGEKDEKVATRNKCNVRWPESSRGNKGAPLKSGNKRNKVLPVTSTIDSRAIRPSMHLNEPLQNSSTGVLNSDRSPLGRAGRTRDTGGRNLNRLMENTSTSREITVGTFNEKPRADGAGYLQSNRNEVDRGDGETFVKRKSMLPSNVIVKEGSVPGKDDGLSYGRKRSSVGSIKNYTPQKRTLKDLSFRNSHDLREKKNSQKCVDTGYGSKTNIPRSGRQVRNGKNLRISRRRSRGVNNAFPRRGRRKRGKMAGNDEGMKQVYLDMSRNLRPRTGNESRSSQLAHGLTSDKKAEQERKDELITRNEANWQDSLDKQIEDEFTRISDAFKEDTMGPKGVAEERKGEPVGVSNDNADAENKLKETDDVPPKQLSDEILDANRVTAVVFNAKMDDANRELDVNQGTPFVELRNQGPGEQVVAKDQSNQLVNEFLNNIKSSTYSSELVISPTVGVSSTIDEQNQAVPNNLDDLTNAAGVPPFHSFNDNALMNAPPSTTEVTGLTRALIVVDFFKMPNDSQAEPPQTTTPKSDGKFLDKLSGLKKHIEKALGQFRPVHQMLNTTEGTTILVIEPTTTNATTAGSLETTRITDTDFRPLENTEESAKLTSPGGAEFHNEIVIDGVTIPNESDELTVPVPTPRSLVGLESISSRIEGPKSKRAPSMKGRRRKKKRTTSSVIKTQGSEVLDDREADRRPYRSNPKDDGIKKRATRGDSAVKFSFEARNVNLVKKKLGRTNCFSSEQRNYLRLRIDNGDKSVGRLRCKHKPRKRKRGKNGGRRHISSAESRRQAISDCKASTRFPTNNKLTHPWLGPSETTKFAIYQSDHFDHAFSGRGKKAMNEASLKEVSSNLVTNDAPGRILPPCTKKANRRRESGGTKNVICEADANSRGRRLLSVSTLKDNKGSHRSNKDQKRIQDDRNNYMKGNDMEYGQDAAEDRKHLKSVHDKEHEKSKKRDTTRAALKRKKKKKGRDKKHSLTSSKGPPDDDDYFISQEGENEEYNDGTFVEEGQADDDNNPEDVSKNSFSTPDESLGKESDEDPKISKDVQDDNSYNQLIDNSVPDSDFDKYPDGLKTDNQISPIGEEKSRNVDVQNVQNEVLGKDFEISLTGKIHLETDSNGRPVSISFNGAPEFFKQDSIGDGKATSYGNRFPLESADSFIDASDTLVSAGTDNANFLPNVFDTEQSLNPSVQPIDDRSIAREYRLHMIRDRSRNTDNYKNEGYPRQKLLHLQKKSVEANKNPAKEKQLTQVKSDSEKCLKRSKKESSNFAGDSNLVPDEVEGREELAELDQGDSLSLDSLEDRNHISLSNDHQNIMRRKDDKLYNDSPQISLDLTGLPENSLVNVDTLAETSTGACFCMNLTTQTIDLPETSTNANKYLGAITKTTLLSIHDLVNSSSSVAASAAGEHFDETTTPGATTSTAAVTTTAQPTTTTEPTTRAEPTTTTEPTTTSISSRNETVIEAKMSYPKPAAVAHVAKSVTNYSTSGEENKESIERKNMLAVSEFVKKLEKLVSDSGNSSNATARTLIHLKKFIIVPDNRTFWSLKEYSAPENLQRSTATETVVVVGDGAPNKDYKKSVDSKEETKYPEGGDDDKLDEDDSNLIKEIINSVIKGDDMKREVPLDKFVEAKDNPKLSQDQTTGLKTLDATVESVDNGPASKQEAEIHLDVGKDSEGLAKVQGATPEKREATLRNVRRNIDDQFPESNLENETKTAKKDNNVCTESKSNAKEKREAILGDGRSVAQKRKRENHGKRKEAMNLKKKRRKKRKRKSKKKKGGRKKGSKKKKIRWPFKRNLLMLSDEEQIQPLNVDYGTKWRGRDKFSAHQSMKKKVRYPGKSGSGAKFKEPQIRGGQDCSDPRHPRNVNPFKYLESAHCLRFSDLWYSVYQLEEPIILHNVHLQVYVKRVTPSGSTAWKDLTNGSPIRLGTFDTYYRNRESTMAFVYNDMNETSNTKCTLDSTRDRLLVPSTLSGKSSKYSEAEGWSNEYLVVQADKISEDANECDKAGVGFTAFVDQPDRCERASGTCLKNQPLDYWRHDIEAREAGRAGCYFLSNFARVPSEAIKYNVNGTGSREFLALEYHSPHVSVIDVELRDDYNALLRAGSLGRLTEVYIDNLAIDQTVITVLITNKGSSSGSYRVRITDCPKGLPVSWSNAESATKTIPPHRDRKVAVELHGRLSLNEFSCSVVLFNDDEEQIARREIKVRRLDYCFCVRHCLCSCTSDVHGTDCHPMSLDDYHTAGFEGPLPLTPIKTPPTWTDVLTIVTLILAALLLLLLLLGLLKWMIGLCAPTVGRWGLDDLLVRNKMTEYYEKDLKLKSVVVNQLGEPVHPETGRKSVRICSRKLAFLLNLTFFCIHPLVICCLSCMKPARRNPPGSSRESKASHLSENDDSYKMIRVNTYGDNADSKMEAEDTKYVIDELKKSQESLQNHNRYQRKQTLRDDTSSD